MYYKKLAPLAFAAAAITLVATTASFASEFSVKDDTASHFYTQQEIQQGRTLGQSSTTLTNLNVAGKTTWFSLTQETHVYKDATRSRHALVRMDDQKSDNNWCGEIALFPVSKEDLSKVYKTLLGFSDFIGTSFDSVIEFKYLPRNLESHQKPYVILSKSNAGYQQGGQGYNQFTRKCFIDFVKQHTDAELIFSDARNPISKHVLTKPEFGFQNALTNEELASYIKGMAVPYYLEIKR